MLADLLSTTSIYRDIASVVIGRKYNREIEQDQPAMDAHSACRFNKHMVWISSVYIGFARNMLFPVKRK